MASVSQGGMSTEKEGETRKRPPLDAAGRNTEQTLPKETAQSALRAKRNMESILPNQAGAIGG